MRFEEPFAHPAVVEMHLPGGYTRVRLFALGQGEGWWEIPTDKIPLHLRPLGSRIFITTPRFTVEPGDRIEEIRKRVQEAEIRELVEDDLRHQDHKS